MNMVFRLAAVSAFALIGLAAPASATLFLEQTKTFNQAGPAVLTFDKFNIDNAILDSVDVIFDGTASRIFTVTRPAGVNGNKAFTVSGNLDFGLYGADNFIKTRSINVAGSLTPQQNSKAVTVNYGSQFEQNLTGDLSFFIGSGSFDTTVNSTNSLGVLFTHPGQTTKNITGAQATYNGFATIKYNYDLKAPIAAVPEPATWAMMIGGMGLVGASMRRRKTNLQFA